MGNQVLFIGYGSTVQDEILEFLKGHDSNGYFADTGEEAIHILEDKPVHTVALSMHSLKDAAILDYINRNHPDKEVIISATKEYNEIIQTLSNGHFSVVRQPLRLKDLAALLF